jgi:hypothetical protein
MMLGMERYYSPRIDRELVSLLYREGKRLRLPMTRLSNRLPREALSGVFNGRPLSSAEKNVNRERRSNGCEATARTFKAGKRNEALCLTSKGHVLCVDS